MRPKLIWLLDEKQEEAGASDLRAAIEAIGDWRLTISRQEARNGTGLTIPLHDAPVLAYGSIEFTKAIRNDFYPGRWCDWTALRCEYYYANLGAFLLNDDYILLPAGEVRRRYDFSGLRSAGPMFLRPSRADKPFSGFVAGVDNAEEIERRLANMEAHDLVVIAPAKTIEAEYRTVVVRGKGIIAASQYMKSGLLDVEPGAPEEAHHVSEAVAAAIGMDFPDAMYVVDIAKCDEEYRLLEINGFSFSNFYACDLEAIVRAAREEALREWKQMEV